MTANKHTITLAAVAITANLIVACKAKPPGPTEQKIASEAKAATIGGKDWKNPVEDSPATVKNGAEHFQHHCEICHGLDGQNTGVPFADKMSPPVADLAAKAVQDYTDGQIKWIIENGIRYSGMPGWSGVLDDNEMWSIVNYIRHLPAKGSLGAPQVFKEAEQEHESQQPEHSSHHH